MELRDELYNKIENLSDDQLYAIVVDQELEDDLPREHLEANRGQYVCELWDLVFDGNEDDEDLEEEVEGYIEYLNNK